MPHKKLLFNLMGIYDQKNLAYGNSAHRTFCRYGKASYSLRLSDKFQRYETLITSPDIPDIGEAIEDTLGDAITYTFMFAADLFCSTIMGDGDPDSMSNMDKVHQMMDLTACCTEEEIKEMAHTFWQNFVEGEDSLVDVIYNMYLDQNTTSMDYVMLATYLIKLYLERITPA